MGEYAAGGSAAMSMIGGIVGSQAAISGAEAQAQGIFSKGRAEADSAFFNAGQFEFQALIDERDRSIALQQAQSDAKDLRVKHVAEMGAIRAAYGWSGLSLEGSPLDVLEATAIEENLDTNKTLYAGEVVAAGFTDKAAQARAQASMLRYSGSYALTAANVGAAAARTAGGYASATALISGASGAFKSATPARA